ncbi:helix-turn-helix domain-containing protein [Anaerobacillus isosaccharinicus]|uniref:Helix-turn-helix domain-containing protein n=1 Tax=Anaerobacillus isosaccharinicus TaxID=1532552 RepID=A0A1S2M8B4_9BACI|nr:helix-turn-helix transcriptional regulator [Anaerobacillus isosaccharinicus]MBA5584533.1 helix-turn-helix domain-containing protein [Anaerobacillus isosaccharinicus]QOY37084.1 helix-turn-helix domain-containing protein [Anaerobacillus isosaccharinicus]
MGNELGKFLEELRGKLSLREAANKSSLSHTYIRDLELGINRKTQAPIRPSADTLIQLANAYNCNSNELLKRAGYIVEEEKSNYGEDLPALNERDERDIQKKLEEMINSLSSKDGFAAFDGNGTDDLDEEDREILIASLENSLRLAKRMAKQKFTPKKYRK